MLELLFNYHHWVNEEKILKIRDECLNKIKNIYDNISKTPNMDLKWSNQFQPFIDWKKSYLDFEILRMKNFYNPELKDLCYQVENEINKLLYEQQLRDDVFKKFKFWYEAHYPFELLYLENKQILITESLRIEYEKNGFDIQMSKHLNLDKLEPEPIFD